MQPQKITLTCPFCGLVDGAHVPPDFNPATEEAVSVCTRCLKPAVLTNTADGDPMLRVMDPCEAIQVIASPEYVGLVMAHTEDKPVLRGGVATWIANTQKEHEHVHGRR